MDYKAEAQKRKNTMIENIQGIVAIPSILDEKTATKTAPFGLEVRRALDWMLEKGRADGFRVIDVDGYAGAIIYGDHEENVSMLAHLDVVPVGEGWTKDPFGGEIVDGYIFGRGVEDDKGPAIVAYEAMKMIRDSGQVLSKNIMLVVGCDEESGMSCIEYFKEHGPKSLGGFVPDAEFPVVYGEKDGFIGILEGEIDSVITHFTGGERPNVVIAKARAEVRGEAKPDLFAFFLEENQLKGKLEIGSGTVTYELYGKGAHASLPDQGINSGVALLQFIGAAYHDTFATQLGFLLKDYYGMNMGIKFNGAYMGPLTMNTGIIQIADKQARITLDIRFPSDFSEGEIVANIEKHLKEANIQLELAHYETSTGVFVSPDSDLVQNLMASYREVTGDDFTPPQAIGGGTYARHFPNHVAFGMEFNNRPRPSWVGNIHEKDEGVAIIDLIDSLAIYALALSKLAR